MNTKELLQKLENLTEKLNQAKESHQNDSNIGVFDCIEWEINDCKDFVNFDLEDLDRYKGLNAKIQEMDDNINRIINGQDISDLQPLSEHDLEKELRKEFSGLRTEAHNLMQQAQKYENKYPHVKQASEKFLADILNMRTKRTSDDMPEKNLGNRIAILNSRIDLIRSKIDDFSLFMDSIQFMHATYEDVETTFRAQLEKTKGFLDFANAYSDQDIKELQVALRARITEMVSFIQSTKFKTLSVGGKKLYLSGLNKELNNKTASLEHKIRIIDANILREKLNKDINKEIDSFGALNCEIVEKIDEYKIKNINIDNLVQKFNDLAIECENNPSKQNLQQLVALNEEMKTFDTQIKAIIPLITNINEEIDGFGALNREIIGKIDEYQIKNINIDNLVQKFNDLAIECENNPSKQNLQQLVALNEEMKTFDTQIKAIIPLITNIIKEIDSFGSLNLKITQDIKEYDIKDNKDNKDINIKNVVKEFSDLAEKSKNNPSQQNLQKMIALNEKIRDIAKQVEDIKSVSINQIDQCITNFSVFINSPERENDLTPSFFKLVSNHLKENPDKIDAFLGQINSVLRSKDNTLTPKTQDILFEFIRENKQLDSLNQIITFINTFKTNNDYKKYLDKPDMIDLVLTLLDGFNDFDRTTIDPSWLNNFFIHYDYISSALDILKNNEIKLTTEIVNGLVMKPDISRVIIQQNKLNNHDDTKFKMDKESFKALLVDFIQAANKDSDFARAMRLTGEKDPKFCEPWLLVYSQYHSDFIRILGNQDNLDSNIAILKIMLGNTNIFQSNINSSWYFSLEENFRNNTIDMIKHNISLINPHSSLLAKSLSCLSNMQDAPSDHKQLEIIAKYLDKLSAPNNKKNEYQQYRQQIIPLLLNKDKLPCDRVKDCERLASDIFKHSDATLRMVFDVLQMITLAFLVIMPVRLLVGKSAFFSQAKTDTQDTVSNQLKLTVRDHLRLTDKEKSHQEEPDIRSKRSPSH